MACSGPMFVKLFHRIYWFSSINLNQVGKKQAPSVSCCQFFFFSSKLLGVCAKEKFGLFELLNTTLTGPNRLVDKRAGVVIKTTVIEPQLVTAPPACFLLGPGIKTQQRCVWALSQLHTESKNWLSGFHGCSRIFFPTFWGDVASPHTLVVLLWFYVACYRWGQKWNHKKTWIFNYLNWLKTQNEIRLIFFLPVIPLFWASSSSSSFLKNLLTCGSIQKFTDKLAPVTRPTSIEMSGTKLHYCSRTRFLFPFPSSEPRSD